MRCFHSCIISNVSFFFFFESMTNSGWRKIVAIFLGHPVRTMYVPLRPRDRIRNSIEIRVAFENRIRNRVASLEGEEEEGAPLKASRLWEDSRIATYALSLRTRGSSSCVPWSPPPLCTGYGNYGRKFGEFAERASGGGGGSKVAWLIALWGFVGQPFIMPVNLVFGQTFQLLIYSLIYCPWILCIKIHVDYRITQFWRIPSLTLSCFLKFDDL